MKNYIKENIIQEKNILTSIQCDVCKEIFNNEFDIQEFTSIRKYCGYGSVFGDEDEIEIDICQDCFKEKLGAYVRYID